MSLHFLTVPEIINEQLDQLDVYGGGTPGVFNMSQLEAAVASAQTASYYIGDDVYEIAAAYLQYLTLGHTFSNGNKRVSLAAALLFLYINGVKVVADPDATTRLVLDATTRQIDKPHVAEFFRNHATSIAPLLDAATTQERANALSEARRWAHAHYAATFSELAK